MPRYKTNLLFASEAVASDDLPHLLFLLDLWVALHHVLQRRQVQIQLLCQMLKQKKKKKEGWGGLMRKREPQVQFIHLPVLC